ncbi:hypothetical protein Taro_034377 [Colocasia esculenta]|uniref:Receptor-like protein 12 n=1 Tax=Colocasia esculenta TaxID=4460 RepID=A0A843WFB6_COLES|nr:hypothetical protein [Colocasia esculenta]
MLSNLTRLNLSDSGFGGQIPAGISRLRSLVSLDLSAYGICSTSSLRLKNPDLKALVGNLTNLQELYLRGVNISAGGHEWGPALSSSLPSLRELDLAGCSLSGPIDSSLSKLTNLTILRLNQNNLSSELPEFLGNLSYLSYLRLSYCGLRGPIPGGIFKLPRLQNLDVSKNPMLFGHLPDFPDNRILENLWLFETNMSGSLPDSIGNLKFLKTLRLSNCIFSGSLPASFANLTQLVFVDLSANNFSGRIPSFASSTNLMELNLQNNSLTGPVPGWLFSLPALRTLQLNLNQLSGELGEFSDEASLLQTVDLSSNKLHGSFPKSVAKLWGIKILKFASNRLNGTVGLDLFANLKNMSILDLSNNLLIVEATSMSFPRVSTLNLASCNLVGFPEFLRNQSILSRLDLSNNLIDGVVPNWLWSVGNGGLAYLNLSHNSLTNFESPPDLSHSALIVLDINSNKLRGQIPLPPPQNLFVDYSNNQFTSTFPSDIVWNLSFTMFFSAANNTLVGEIPSYFCSSTYLQVLDLSVNNFTGQIPKCLLASVNDLRVLNLRDNRLSGSLPGESAERCKLRTLNVNGNMLVGAVPQSLSNCKMLQVLDLGNNQIEDSFPSWLGNLTDLRVLVLRSNRFHGYIPIPNGDNYTSFSMLQILDISSNRFSGRLPAACFRSWKAMTATDEQSGSLVGKLGFLELTHLYYQDSVTVTVKGMEMTLVKILRIFTSIDMSNNQFDGIIPEAVGQLKALHLLNLSSNGLTGPIPSSIGKLALLESLDLSRNHLSGVIPPGLANLSFLSMLNLSNNKFMGQIPEGRQMSTFSSASFEGNDGLCGTPLPKACGDKTGGGQESSASNSLLELDWEFIFIGMGFGGGLALVLGPFVAWSNGRRWYFKHVDRMLSAVVPLGLCPCGQCKDGKVDAEEKADDDGSDTEEEDGGQQRRFCVFCTQLEFMGGTVTIRHADCSCVVEE